MIASFLITFDERSGGEKSKISFIFILTPSHIHTRTRKFEDDVVLYVTISSIDSYPRATRAFKSLFFFIISENKKHGNLLENAKKNNQTTSINSLKSLKKL